MLCHFRKLCKWINFDQLTFHPADQCQDTNQGAQKLEALSSLSTNQWLLSSSVHRRFLWPWDFPLLCPSRCPNPESAQKRGNVSCWWFTAMLESIIMSLEIHRQWATYNEPSEKTCRFRTINLPSSHIQPKCYWTFPPLRMPALIDREERGKILSFRGFPVSSFNRRRDCSRPTIPIN